jgi:hypothetical protein
MHTPDLSRAAWRKSSYSNGSGGSCVEVATLASPASLTAQHIAVRDSKDPGGPVLTFTAHQWLQLITSIKAGRLNLP